MFVFIVYDFHLFFMKIILFNCSHSFFFFFLIVCYAEILTAFDYDEDDK